MLGVPSIAVSLCSKEGRHYETAGRVALEMVQMLREKNVAKPLLLNVNVPDVPYEELRGKVATRLGKRHKAEAVVSLVSPRNEKMYWIGAAGAAQDAGESTDFYAVSQNQVSVTPLQIDLTHYTQLPLVRTWL